MNRFRTFKALLVAAVCAVAFDPAVLRACSACYGDSNSSMSKGLVAGITVLLGVVVTVLGGIATFFVYIAKKSPTDKA